MKQLIVLLLSAALLFSLSSCKKKESTVTVGSRNTEKITTESSKAETSTAETERPSQTSASVYTHPEYDPDDPTPRPDDGDRVVLLADGLTVYLRSATNRASPKFVFFVTNTQERTLKVSISVKAVNRYSFEHSDGVELLPHTAGIVTVDGYDLTLTEELAEAIIEITVTDANRDEICHDIVTVNLAGSDGV